MKKIIELYKKYEEIINYLFWGGIAFFLSMFLYWLFDSVCGWNSVWANTVDWVICVIFTFFTNKFFVFKSKVNGKKEYLIEFGEFVLARLFTLVLEDVIIFVGVNLMGFTDTIPSLIVKFIGQFVVIVTNYILSKLWIFKKKENKEEN